MRKVISIDIEATGLDVTRDRIVELAMAFYPGMPSPGSVPDDDVDLFFKMETIPTASPGVPGFDPVRIVPEPTATSLGLLAACIACIVHIRRRRIRREIRRGLRSPSTSYPV